MLIKKEQAAEKLDYIGAVKTKIANGRVSKIEPNLRGRLNRYHNEIDSDKKFKEFMKEDAMDALAKRLLEIRNGNLNELKQKALK